MAKRANPSASALSRLAAILCFAAVLLTLFPCFTANASAQSASPQPSMAAGDCAPCCIPAHSTSAPALCCAAHQHAAQAIQPVAVNVSPPAFHDLVSQPVPQAPSLAHPASQAPEIRPPLITILRI